MGILYHQVHIHSSQEILYKAIVKEIGSWWDKPKEVKKDESLILEFNPGSQHGLLRMKVLTLEPNSRVEWECISIHPPSSPASAWTGTYIIFKITEKGSVTILDFYHVGWDEKSEYYGFCNYHWGEALQNLKKWCESQNSGSKV
ncbi:MAG: hypothetical protein BGO68_03605 [Candidatus Amoebophilus sp. 36-38]|nr:MAG: hypothetical protein BGO68_03605 [Candidatus Amoebophilus sp. 36-38]